MPNYRKPTEKEAAKLDAARKKTQEGIEGEKDIFSRVSTTAAKSARDDVKAGLKMRESVPASAREGEAYEQAGYKKGGKVMKKMKKYEGGGSIDSDVRARAMKSVEGLEGIKGSDIEDETGTVKGSIKRNEYGDLYDSEMKASVPKKTAEKLTPKAEAPTPKAEIKTTPVAKTGEEKTGFEQKKAKALEGVNVKAEEPKERNLPRGQAKASEGFSGFLKRSIGQIGQEGRDQEARYKAKQAEMKESGAGMSPRMKAAMASEKSKGMKAGGKVKSASARADGCAIRGRTRA
jgi:hypothetical protein